eukprot:CAMPEP_0185025336 /NCGR_PEP_ID=MMETSP1103-20130426/8335_1 /TAXON_ID=36769 /ORGANISM="Paraphysomonas bandaiensis, Strain Caron Lab Isolate" /LENGTH=39 /DNA_ID= /DNA_START= /DNA_END= /DNA_ORIENTATION=
MEGPGNEPTAVPPSAHPLQQHYMFLHSMDMEGPVNEATA